MTYTAGTVSAKIELDTTEFKEAVKTLKNEVKGLKTAFNILKGNNPLDEEVKQLKKEINSLKQTNEDYKKSLNNIRQGLENTAKSSKKFKEEIKKDTEAINQHASALNKADKATQLYRKNFDYFKGNTYNGQNIINTFTNIKKATDESTTALKRFETETGKAVAESIKLRTQQGKENRWGGKKPVDGIKPDIMFNTDWEKIGFQAGKQALQDFLKTFSKAKIEIKKDSHEIENAIRKFAQFDFKTNAGTKFDNFGKSLNQVAQNAKKANEALGNIGKSTQSSPFSEFVGVADKVSSALKNITPLAREAKQQYEQLKTSMTGFAPVTEKGFTAATKGAEQFKQRLVEIATQTKKTFDSLQVALAKANAAQYKYWQQDRGSSKAWNAQPLQVKGYNDYLKSANAISKYNKELERNLQLEKQRRTALAYKDNIAYSAQNFKSASAGLSLLNTQMDGYINKTSKSSTETKKFGDNVRSTGRGITTFNNGIVQTAHSGRILSNTLYQIRGALLSVKMIATAMGGMALWGFAMEIAEGVKTTFTAKNELEAQLKQNAKVGENGLRDFNKELDVTISKFQKVNKYQLGETVASLGVEFNLGMKEMKKAMPIVAMIQSEYVRAGRTSEEAALAVKDILQGEFQRLSRETGVGKDELIQYGWSGDKTDLDSLLDAVKKAGGDRHWDVFAAKATSLNDVLEITKNRFEEFGADFLQSISPMIVSAFNTIIGTIDRLQNAFDGMGSFGRNTLLAGGFLGGVTAIATALPMITKGMGLAEIATLGWGKAIGTAVFNLNKAEVAQYGFAKALAAVISGTNASELANRRATSAILGRVLGVNQAVQAEQGLIGALVHSRMSLKGVTLDANAGAVIMGNLRQKLIYLAKDVIVADKEAATFGRTLKALVTSTKLWGVALKGLIGIGMVAWFASIASWADAVKGRIDLFNDYIDNGKEKIKSAQKTLNNYKKTLDGMSENDKDYYQTNLNKQTAEHNLESAKAASKLAKQIKKDSEAAAEANDLMYTRGLNTIYSDNGLKNVEKYGDDYQQMKMAAYDIAKSEQERHKFEYASLQHINEHTAQMKAAGIEEKNRIKYISEYSAKAKEAAENLKKFNQGDLTAGVYHVINRLQLAWIDLWNDKDFINFWNTVKRTFEDIKPTLIWIKDQITDLGRTLMRYFSTESGRWVGTLMLLSGGFALIGYKLRGVLGTLKDFGTSIWNRIKDLRKLKETTEEVTGKVGGDKSTGGINGDINKPDGKGWIDKAQLQDDVRKYARVATGLAAAMFIISEAIILLNVPMLLLAGTGVMFKAVEPQVRAGIEGLKLIAPTVLALLVPTVALMTVMGYFKVETTTLMQGFKSAALGVALGIGLVVEAIMLLNLPLLSLAGLGFVYSGVGDAARQGVKAMEVINDALMALVPWVPVFAAGIALAAITIGTDGVGGVAILAAAAGIAIGILGVVEVIILLYIPLEAVAQLGRKFSDLSDVEKGAEAIKETAEALKYVSEAFGYLVTVQWDMLKSRVAELLGADMGSALDELVRDGTGFLPKLSNFAEKFNNLTFKGIEPEKAQQLKSTAEGLTSVNEALKSATEAINNLPAEFKNNGTGQPLLNYNMENATTSITGSATGETTSNYFDQLKQPLQELSKFITWFNTELTFPTEGIDTDKLTAINQSADMVTQVNEAVNKVKEVMGNIGMGNIATNFAQTTGGGEPFSFGGAGALMSLGTDIVGAVTGGGQGEYQSSIGGSLYEMELVLQDLATFNNNVSSLGGGGAAGIAGSVSVGTSGVAQGLTDMVTAVSQAISTLETTLAQSVPNIKMNANSIGSGIREGIKTGMGDLTTLVVPPFVSAMQTMKANATTYGKGVGYNLREGFKAEAKMKETVEAEVGYVFTYLDSKKQEFYDKGAALGQSLADGFKSKGLGQMSPGKMARTTLDEMYYMSDSLEAGMGMLPNKAVELGNMISTAFNPQLAMGGLSVDDLSAFQTGLDSISYMADSTNMQTSTAFNNMNLTTTTSMQGMTTTINGAFNNINTNATTQYGRIVNTTRTSLKSMQDQTTKNIGAIKTSWRDMQTALIASAEQIRSETSSKINQLESNMASFWNKIQNPANLLAGSPMMQRHTTPQRRPTGISTNKTSRRMLAAGSPRIGQKNTGISNTFRAKSPSDPRVREMLSEYLYCLMNGGVCAAGGWNFNWSKDIQDVFMQWHTHFGDIYDPYLRVGKFENDDFPVRGIREIALRYIEDAIGRTSYDFYFNERYSPLEAWNRGAFNCVDGANLVIALASAFGFGGGYHGSTTWDGIGHVYAIIPGLGIIDATAIQGNYGLTASKVSYSGAGSHTISQSRPSRNTVPGTTINIGDIHVHIEGDVENPKETGKQIGDEINNRIYKVLRRNLGTGQ